MSAEFSQPDDHGLWRFGIISPLLHRAEDAPPLHAQIKELAQRVFYTPNGREKRLCPDTIRDWLNQYRARGIDGLRNKQRKDQGGTSVPDALGQALTDVRKSQPLWTVKRLLRHVREQGLWDGRKPSRSALYRFTAAHALNRSAVEPARSVRSFEYPYFGDLWTADFLHGPKVRRGAHFFKVYLHAIIDDATRYIVAARFHPTEDTRSLLDDLMLAILRFGVPKRLYTDNGAAFRSQHLRMVAAKLGIGLPHTPPYTPRGRGKVERLFRSVREGFLTGRSTTSLEKLNADFSAWVSQYHQSPHSSLGMSPLNRKLTDTGQGLEQISPTQNINDIFRMELVKRVGSDGCVRLFRKRFEIPDAFPGEMVTIYYLPWDQDYILAGPDKLFVKPLDTVNNALRFDKPHRGGPHHNHKEKDL
jgi:transposase InsO family protein